MKTDLAECYSMTNLVDYAGQQTQRGLAFAWRQSRTRKRSRCQGRGGGLGTDTGFFGHGQLSHPIACSVRATSVSLCARQVSLCMTAASAARVICARARRQCVRARVSREQEPNRDSLIPTPLVRTVLRWVQILGAPKAARTHHYRR